MLVIDKCFLKSYKMQHQSNDKGSDKQHVMDTTSEQFEPKTHIRLSAISAQEILGDAGQVDTLFHSLACYLMYNWRVHSRTSKTGPISNKMYYDLIKVWLPVQRGWPQNIQNMTFKVDLCFCQGAAISYIFLFVCFVFWHFLYFVCPFSNLSESHNEAQDVWKVRK